MNRKYVMDESPGYQLFQASRVMNAKLNENFKKIGHTLTYEQWQIMSRLYGKEGQTQRMIAVSIERDEAGTSRLLGRMEKAGYIYRYVNPEDKRRNYIYPTEWARQEEEKLNRTALDTIDEACAGMTEEEKRSGQLFLEKIRNNLGSS
ncbi:MarR family winged helix-turn-helix transcriptional regulator [Salimicrobium humidisoli]|uniref:MarR family transcriptional regulator n=1 Tax=Salimicrobium humidisoli TaxID=2029857 RepID=A0ABX4HTD5_9BACI|nr:MarR family transcriptional regulator [Salimicrobium humidisoli]PBB05801.1 MarR family transcriptional regulator [Salimicrobium humidisoli]